MGHAGGLGFHGSRMRLGRQTADGDGMSFNIVDAGFIIAIMVSRDRFACLIRGSAAICAPRNGICFGSSARTNSKPDEKLAQLPSDTERVAYGKG